MYKKLYILPSIFSKVIKGMLENLNLKKKKARKDNLFKTCFEVRKEKRNTTQQGFTRQFFEGRDFVSNSRSLPTNE